MHEHTVRETRSFIEGMVEDVEERGQAFTITKHGKPVAVLIGIEEYERLVRQSDDEAATR